LNDHIEASSEEHLRKTWFKLLRTTERLNELKAVEDQIEELQTDKESMKMLLDGNSEEINDLKLTAKKLEVENMALKKDVAALQKQLEEVKLTAADDKEEVSSLKSEYKALKKEVEELRCSKAYPVKRVPEKSEKIMRDEDFEWPPCVQLSKNTGTKERMLCDGSQSPSVLDHSSEKKSKNWPCKNTGTKERMLCDVSQSPSVLDHSSEKKSKIGHVKTQEQKSKCCAMEVNHHQSLIIKR